MSTDTPDRSAIAAALSILKKARSEDLRYHVEDINCLYLRLKPGGSARSPSSVGSTDRLGRSSDCGSGERTECDRVKRPNDAKKAGTSSTVDQLLKSVKKHEPDIRALFHKSVNDLIQESCTNEDVRISDIRAGESAPVEAKFRRVLASRSLVLDFERWKISRQKPTVKAFSSHIGVSYENHRRKFSRAQMILEYENSAMPAISIIFVFCWTHAVKNNNISGFIDRLKRENEGLYGFLEKRVDWLKKCQCMYDDRCVSRNKAKATERLFLCQSVDDLGGQDHGGRKRKSPPAACREDRNCRRRVTKGQIVEFGTEDEVRSSTAQGAVSQTETRDIENGQVDAMQDAPQPADQSRQSGGLRTGNEVFQAQYGFPNVSALERVQDDSTSLVAEQSNHQYLPAQYNLAHEQQNTEYRPALDSNASYVGLDGDFGFFTDLRVRIEEDVLWGTGY